MKENNIEWLQQLSLALEAYSNVLRVHITSLPVEALHRGALSEEAMRVLHVDASQMEHAEESMLMTVTAQRYAVVMKLRKTLGLFTMMTTFLLVGIAYVLALLGMPDMVYNLFESLVFSIIMINLFGGLCYCLMRPGNVSLKQDVDDARPIVVLNVETSPLAFMTTLKDFAKLKRRTLKPLNWLYKHMDKALREFNYYSTLRFLNECPAETLHSYFGEDSESFRSHCGLYPSAFTLIIWQSAYDDKAHVSWYLHTAPTKSDIMALCDAMVAGNSSDDMTAYEELDPEYKRVNDNLMHVMEGTDGKN